MYLLPLLCCATIISARATESRGEQENILPAYSLDNSVEYYKEERKPFPLMDEEAIAEVVENKKLLYQDNN